MTLKKEDIIYFKRGIKENPIFWERLGGPPNFKGKKVLDIGCGHGSLCVDIAKKGAKKVIGVDLDDDRINFAQENLKKNYPEFKKRLEFISIDVADLDEKEFDFIVSKDTFEHIIDLDGVLKQIRKRLKKNGKLYVGIAPLYFSPMGDHGRTHAKIPWGHLIFSESYLLKRASKIEKKKIKTIYDLGLNKLYLNDYYRLFKSRCFSLPS